ncbi:MAG: beta-ketoacyl synthase N-terminal-like domain-containing protein, partial [Solirubrobacteraceae bacterium]
MSEPALIAIVGMACRLPGASDPQAFWRLLRDERDAITPMPAERWAMYERAGVTADMPGARDGGFLDDLAGFDAAFFGISPNEAAAMDPQQRLILELSWEALEDAGIIPNELADSRSGVFVGAIYSDYNDLLHRAGIDALTRHAFTGTQRSIISNRVSYTLGLRGPSLAVDAGQSSGLVAVHLACESLRRSECTIALAGGVNLNITPESTIAVSRLGALSPDARCFTLDSRANGTVRGEGGALVLLKPLARAITDGDPIYCVIRGSAINNDGGGHGLTAPRRQAQEELLHLAYAKAAAKPTDVQYVELHGTGTRLGDRVEAAALSAVLSPERAQDDRLRVGSAKTNVGHLEAAAGIVGLIKTALCFTHDAIPASLHFSESGDEIPLDALGLQVQTKLGPWPTGERLRLAGVSSFGIGGTNCHVVVEEPPRIQGTPPEADTKTRPPALTGATAWVLSAKSKGALRDQARCLAAHMQSTPQPDVNDVGYSLATSRSVFDHRAVALGSSGE